MTINAGTITFHCSLNFGSVLQTFALQKMHLTNSIVLTTRYRSSGNIMKHIAAVISETTIIKTIAASKKDIANGIV